jgi:hypothetical protein
VIASAVCAMPASISCVAARIVRMPVAHACIRVGPPTRGMPASPVNQGSP